ncbi:MAG: hypothetical protein VB088_08180 [Sphaerochaeta sp.]|nr:hypothetical protein [Sphaerochaeta sp.]
MTHTITNIETNKWLVSISFADEGVPQGASTTVIGTEEQAHAYAQTLARDFRENHADLFPPPVVEEHDHMEGIV